MACEHANLATDNIVTWCLDCEEDFSAVTLSNFPRECCMLFFGRPTSERCACGDEWKIEGQGFWCTSCNAYPPDEHPAGKDGW